MRRALLSAAFSLLVFGCASITGLGKDYDFSDDASTDGSTGGEGGVTSEGGNEGGKGDGGSQC